MRLPHEIDIRDIAAAPGQEARILLALDGLPDAEAIPPSLSLGRAYNRGRELSRRLVIDGAAVGVDDRRDAAE
jgi:hypothetical protein